MDDLQRRYLLAAHGLATTYPRRVFHEDEPGSNERFVEP